MPGRTCRTCGDSLADITELLLHRCDAILRAPDLTRTEQSTLLYVEGRVVDHGGVLHPSQMNYEDENSLKVFSVAGMLDVSDVQRDPENAREEIRYVEEFSEAAWELASEARQMRAARNNDRDIDLSYTFSYPYTRDDELDEPEKYGRGD